MNPRDDSPFLLHLKSTYIFLHVTKFQESPRCNGWFSQNIEMKKKKKTIGNNVNRLITIQIYRRMLILNYFPFPNYANSREFLHQRLFMLQDTFTMMFESVIVMFSNLETCLHVYYSFTDRVTMVVVTFARTAFINPSSSNWYVLLVTKDSFITVNGAIIRGTIYNIRDDINYH